jgi:hypothetical protein
MYAGGGDSKLILFAHRLALWTVLGISVLLAPGVGKAADALISDEPLLRADTSFSKHPLNQKTVPQEIGRLLNGADCDEDILLCEWADPRGTIHIVAGELLAIKFVDVANLGDQHIQALDIGISRRRANVLARVGAFLPEVTIDCLEDGAAGEGSSCFSTRKIG